MLENCANNRRRKNELHFEKRLSCKATACGCDAVVSTFEPTRSALFLGADKRGAFFSIIEMPDGKWRSLFEVLIKDSVFASFAGLRDSVPDAATPIQHETVLGFDGCYGCQRTVSREVRQ